MEVSPPLARPDNQAGKASTRTSKICCTICRVTVINQQDHPTRAGGEIKAGQGDAGGGRDKVGDEGRLQDILLLFSVLGPPNFPKSKPALLLILSILCLWLFPALHWMWGLMKGSKPSAFYITFIKHHLTLSVPIKACEVHAR